MSNKMSAETESLLASARDVAVLQHKLRLLNIEAAHRLAWYHSHYNPNQPRVPAGDPRGGQWTREGNVTGVQLAASEKLPWGRGTLAAILLHLAAKAIEAYRKENGLQDLFGHSDGTVTVLTLQGENIFGSNSSSPTYGRTDRNAADALRESFIRKYPDWIKRENIGQKPNDALYHAETTVLLRAARKNGGTLAGLTLEVFSDRPMCHSCRQVLPDVGLELGNPTVTFIDPQGERLTMRDGMWVK